MVSKCSDKYDSENRIYMEYMDENSVSKSNYIYSCDEEPEYSDGM